MIALLFATMFVAGTETLVLSPVLPQMASELAVSIQTGAHWVTSYAVCTGISAFLFGPISDQTNRKWVLVTGVVILGVGTIACGFATDFWTLAIARSLSGAGSGILSTCTTSYVADKFDARNRGTAMGWIMNGFFVALVLGVPVGAGIANSTGWRVMFFVLGAIALLLAGLIAAFLPRIQRPTPVASPATPFAFATALQTAFSGYYAIVQRRHVWALLQTASLVGMSMTMFSVYLSPWLEERFALDTLERGLVYAVGAPAAIAAAPIAGRISGRVGRLPVIVVGNLATMVMMVLVSLSADIGQAITPVFWSGTQFDRVLPFAPLVVFSFLLLASSASRGTSVHTLTAEAVESSLRGSMAACRNLAFQLSVALGATVGGYIWASTGERFIRICVFAAVLTAVSTVLLIWLGRDAPGALPRTMHQTDAPSRA